MFNTIATQIYAQTRTISFAFEQYDTEQIELRNTFTLRITDEYVVEFISIIILIILVTQNVVQNSK